jgi:hypothetical protein
MIASKDLTLTETAWHTKDKRSLSHLRVIDAQQLISNHPESIIKKLAQELSTISGVKRVQAIATSFPDIHWIDFKIELEADIRILDETWEKIQDMVIDCEWKLIDDTEEEWYFRPQRVNRFYDSGDRVIADSIGKLKISRSNPLKFVVL